MPLRLTRASHRNPSRFRIAVFLLLFSFGGSLGLCAVERTDSPALISSYRGKTDRVLAHTSKGKITESEIFLYLLISGLDTPLLCDLCCQAPQGPERDALRARLKSAIENYNLTTELARQAGGAQGRLLQELRVRIKLLPVQEVVWIDRYLAPQVNVTPEDVKKYYGEHPELALIPRRAQVRYIVLGFSPDTDARSQIDLEVRANTIRDRIVKGELSFEDAARQFSDAPNAAQGGIVGEFEDGTYFASFEEQAFSLKPGGISPLVFGPDGIYLIEGVAQIAGGAVPVEKLDARIRDELYRKQLQHRYTFEMKTLREKTETTIRASMIESLRPQDAIAEAGSFRITQGEAWRIFTDFVDEHFELRKSKLDGDLRRICSQELIAQDNRRRGFAGDPVFARSREIALALLNGEQRFWAIVGPLETLTKEEVREYPVTHPKPFASLTSRRCSFIQARILKGGELGIARRDAEMRRMRAALEGARDAYSTVTLAQMAPAWPVRLVHPADLIPMAIENRVIRQVDESIEVLRWNSVSGGAKLMPEFQKIATETGAKLAAFAKTGQRFLPIVEVGDALLLPYVEQPNYTIPAIQDLIFPKLYEAAARDIEIRAVDRLREESVRDSQLELAIP